MARIPDPMSSPGDPQPVDTGHLPVARLKGVGPRVAERLARLSIHTVQDLLFHLPLRYQDRTRIVPIGSLRVNLRGIDSALNLALFWRTGDQQKENESVDSALEEFFGSW